MEPPDAAREPPEPAGERRLWRRHGLGLEFDRLAFFTDAVFAIAITLIAVEIGVPEVERSDDAAGLWDGVVDDVPSMVAFFVTFAIIAGYWIANHRFVSSLRAIDARLVVVTVAYLAFVAFLPYPASMLGRYSDNGTAVALFALAAAAVSTMEAVQIAVAARGGLFATPMSPAAVRWSLVGSLSPVGLFLVSIPVALLVSPLLGIGVWLVSPAIGVALDARAPAELRSPRQRRR